MGTFSHSSLQLLVAVGESQLRWSACHHFPVPVFMSYFMSYSSLVIFFAVRFSSSIFYITVLVLLLWSFYGFFYGVIFPILSLSVKLFH